MAYFSPYFISVMLPNMLNITKWDTALGYRYLGLLYSQPSGDTYSEVTNSEYARQLITTYNAQQRGDGSTSNNSDILFPIASTSWGTITHIGIFDAQTGGNLFIACALAQPISITANQRMKIPTNTIKITMT